MIIELDEGQNIIEIKYKSPYMSFILIGILFAGIVVTIAWLIYKKKPIVFDKVSIVIPYMVIAVALALTLFFFVFPIGVYVKKFIGTYAKIIFK